MRQPKRVRADGPGPERDRAGNSTGVVTGERESFSPDSRAARGTSKVSFRPRATSLGTESADPPADLPQILAKKAENAKRREGWPLGVRSRRSSGYPCGVFVRFGSGNSVVARREFRPACPARNPCARMAFPSSSLRAAQRKRFARLPLNESPTCLANGGFS